MNIVYTVDNKFVPQLATGICSICENNKEEDVCFYVVSKGITDDNKDALTRYVEKYGKKICIIELSNVKDYIDLDNELDVKQIAEAMTKAGNEYDSAEKLINATKLGMILS